jgi:HNH endonuclease.
MTEAKIASSRGQCYMDDCCATIHARDMCFKHYMRTRRHGDPTVTLLDRSHGATCSVPGCDRPYRSKGLCFMHWQRINSGRDLGPAEPINQRYGPDAKCSVSGCQRRPQRNWLCEMHADRLEDRGHVGGVDPERKPAGSGHVRADGYVEVRCSADHPLSRGGRTLLHRLILWSHIGLGPHPCNWCGCPVDWMYGLTDGALVVDHVDFDTTNNDPSNLVPACIVCNMNRPRL